MNEFFSPTERAFLCDYFGIERPEPLRTIDVRSPAGSGEVYVEPDFWGTFSAYSLGSAVARLLLSQVQDRLPQWAAIYETGHMELGRAVRERRPGPAFLLPQFLFEINWADSGPGFSWPEAYHACHVPGFGRYVVTASADSTDGFGYEDLALGWFPEKNPIKAGARELIARWWAPYRDAHHPGWCAVFRAGCVSEDEALEWRAAVWGAPRARQSEGRKATLAATKTNARSDVGPSTRDTAGKPDREAKGSVNVPASPEAKVY
jgi:hypothetical protein